MPRRPSGVGLLWFRVGVCEAATKTGETDAVVCKNRAGGPRGLENGAYRLEKTARLLTQG